MYTLYYVPDACSLATQTVLRELKQDVTIINKQFVEDFAAINPVKTVPVLNDGKRFIMEGAAVMMYLLKRHPSGLFPQNEEGQLKAIQDIMFANATMHPAYSRLFFISQNLPDSPTQERAYKAAENAINDLWQVVESRLEDQPFLGGSSHSAADIMLTVYSRWGAFFPVNIKIGVNTSAMLESVLSLSSFQASINAEQQQAA